MDLSRIQRILSEVGDLRLAKAQWKEESAIPFERDSLKRYGQIMGWEYQVAKMSYTTPTSTDLFPCWGILAISTLAFIKAREKSFLLNCFNSRYLKQHSSD